MCRKWAWLWSAIAALSLTAGMARGQSAPEKAERLRSDLYGDPLPKGALARIGTVRLRHGDFVNCVCFSHDGKTVVSGSVDGTLRSWEAATGKEIHCFRGHQSVVMSLSLSKDGKTLASIGQDFTIRIWDLVSGKELHKLDAPRGACYDLCFSPDGQSLASCGQHIRIWETKTYRVIREFEKEQKWIYCLAFSSDGKTLAAGDQKGEIGFWDTANWKELRRVRAHTKEVRSLAFSPDGKLLASAGEDGLLSLRKPTTGEEIRPLFKGEPCACSRLAFSPDGKTLANICERMELWEVATGRVRHEFEARPVPSGATRVCFSPDGRLLAAACWEKPDGPYKPVVKLWDWRDPCRQTKSLGTGDIEQLWNDLSSKDATVGYQAIAALLAHPRRALAVLAKRLRRVEFAAPDELNRLIANLDDDSFAVRERACKRLAVLGEAARPALQRIVTQRPSVEVRRRIEDLLPRLSPDGVPGRLRFLRAVEVLETIGTEEARHALTNLAGGAEGCLETEDAKAALKRLKHR